MKKDDTKVISVRLNPDEVSALQRLAEDEFRPVACCIRMFVVKALREKGYLKEDSDAR